MSTCKIKLIEGLVSKDQSLDDLSLELFAAVGDIADAIIFKDDISHKIGCAFAVVISIHKLRLYDYSMDSRVARITQLEDQLYYKHPEAVILAEPYKQVGMWEAVILAELYKQVGMWVEGEFSVSGNRADRVDGIIYALMYLANCNKHKLLDCLDDYLSFSASLRGIAKTSTEFTGG